MADLDRSLGAFFWNGVRVSLRRPRHSWQFLRTVRNQATAAKVRRSWMERGVKVPPIIIFSITHQCNLECVGCYARSFQPHEAEAGRPTPAEGESRGTPCIPTELGSDRLATIVDEAAELGVSFFVVVGGEPLMRPKILDIAKAHPRILFLLLTNGLLLDERTGRRLAGLRNVVPLLSLEGTAAATDARRGRGTYRRVLEAMYALRERDAFFGCSITLTSANFFTVLDERYVGDLVKMGCSFFLLLDYTPAEPGTDRWVLNDDQRAQVAPRLSTLRGRFPALFVAVPWDEQEVGGCLSAGRGFVHINASGDVEPCPFAPYSDANLNQTSLAEALRSPFLAVLRERPELSEYTGGGCALWKHHGLVERLLAEQRAVARGGLSSDMQ